MRLDSYSYSFQGQEHDDEVKGKGNSINYKYRMHDPRIGRFFAVDPLTREYPELTPYQFSSNSPIYMAEIEGLEGEVTVHKQNDAGNWVAIWTYTDEDIKTNVNKYYYTNQYGAVTKTVGKTKDGSKRVEFKGKATNKTLANALTKKSQKSSAKKDKTKIGVEGEVLGKFGNTLGGNAKIGGVGVGFDLAYGVFEGGYNSSDGTVNQYRVGAGGNIAFFGGSSSTIYVLPGDARVDALKDEGVNLMIIEQTSFQFFISAEVNIIKKYKADLPDEVYNFKRSDLANYNTIGNGIVSAPRTQIGETQEENKGYFGIGGGASAIVGGQADVKVTFEGGGGERVHKGWATGYCFVAGTQITMSDGSLKRIEDVVVGDVVMTFNLLNDSLEPQEVKEVISPVHDELALIEFSNEVSNRNTLDHPYYVKGKGWASYSPELTFSNYGMKVNKLKEGDICITYYGDKVREEKIIKISVFVEEQMTYNLSKVAKNNNFFANGVLVHNKAIPEMDYELSQELIVIFQEMIRCMVNQGNILNN